MFFFFFFFNDTATTEIYTLSLHDALPISPGRPRRQRRTRFASARRLGEESGSRARLLEDPADARGRAPDIELGFHAAACVPRQPYAQGGVGEQPLQRRRQRWRGVLGRCETGLARPEQLRK